MDRFWDVGMDGRELKLWSYGNGGGGGALVKEELCEKVVEVRFVE